MRWKDGSGPTNHLIINASTFPLLRETNAREYAPIVSKIVETPFDELVAMSNTPAKSLTLILLLDQLTRNYSRGSPFPFKTCDPISLKLAEHFVLNAGHDKQHPPYKRIWYYLPFMHCESIAYQELALAKFAETCWELREGEWKDFHDLIKLGLEASWQHFAIISRFGRYPSRNKALGRESTEDEKKFLEEDGTSFK